MNASRAPVRMGWVRFTLGLALVTTALLAGGCRKKEPIARYKAPKEPTWRMLGAIVPSGEQTWFFKAVGPGRRLAEHKEEFSGLLRSVKFEGGEPRWTLPSGWKEERGAGGERLATLRFGRGDPLLELTVVRLEGTAGGALANVNRWRGQLGLEPVSAGELARVTFAQEVGGAPATVVDFEGPQKPSMAPFARQEREAPPGPSGSRETVRKLFDFELPAGWVENPRPSSGRIFEIRAGEADKAATVYLNVLGETAGGLAANVNRWRGQIGLGPMTDEAAERLVQAVPFLEGEGNSVELTGSEKALVCVFTVGPPWSIFLKMDGATEAVERQRRAFWEFVRTVRINRKHG